MRFGLNIELSKLAVAQSDIMNFNSFCRVGDTYLAANENGLYSINECVSGDTQYMLWESGDRILWESGDPILWETGSTTSIDSYFIIPRTDFGILNQKRLRTMYVGYEATGNMRVTITTDENISRSIIMPPVLDSLQQHGNKFPLTRDLKGRYFEFKIENISGCDFSIDRIEILAIVLGRKPRGV